MRNNLNFLIIAIKSEVLKARNTVALWLTLLYPLGSVTLTMLFHFAERSRVTPDNLNFINNFNGLSSFFLPFYAVLMVSFFCQMEHRNSMFKHLLALPIPRWAVFYGKLTATLLLLMSAWVLMMTLAYVSLLLLGWLSPKLELTSAFEHAYFIRITFRSFLSTIAMVVIQYLLSLKMRNVVASVSIGTSLIILPVAILFVLGITGLITNPGVLKWLPKYDPYSFPYSFVFNFSTSAPPKQEFFSMPLAIWTVVAILLAVAGYYEFRRRNIK